MCVVQTETAACVLCAVQSETAACVLFAVQSETAACVLCAVQSDTLFLQHSNLISRFIVYLIALVLVLLSYSFVPLILMLI